MIATAIIKYYEYCELYEPIVIVIDLPIQCCVLAETKYINYF